MEQHIRLGHEGQKLPHPNWTLWRYMDFAKFFDFIAHKRLYLCSLMKQEDPFEGVQYTQGETAKNMFFQNMKTIKNILAPNSKLETFIDQQKDVTKNFRKATCINSWRWTYSEKEESYAMWKLFAKDPSSAIAVTTTYQKLQDEMEKSPEEYQPINIGMVEYIDYENPPDHFYEKLPHWYKRNIFDYEQEVRIVNWSYPDQIKERNEINRAIRETYPFYRVELKTEYDENGFYLPVSPIRFINHIYVSPFAPSYFLDNVKNLLGKVGLPKELADLAPSAKIKPGY